MTNPSTDRYPETVQPVSELFNAIFRGLFLVLDRLFDSTSNQTRGVGVLYLLMADLMSQLARFLVEQPIGEGLCAAPTFEIYDFSSDRPLEELVALAARCADLHPELSTVHEGLRGLSFIL